MQAINEVARPNEGLEGVVVASTRLSKVDGEAGRLLLAGYPVERLALNASVEDVAALLWHGSLPSVAERRSLQGALAEGRAAAHALLPRLQFALQQPAAMDALRGAIGQLPHGDGQASAARLTGAMAVFTAAHHRLSIGQHPVGPDPGLDHAADFLRILSDGPVSAARARAMSAYLVTVSDHGMNASTFAARVVTSTGSDPVSAVTAAVGALKGPLHGGAPGPVLDMLDAVGSPGAARAFIDGELEAGRRIMGMGHRVYRVRDPRAAVLQEALQQLRNLQHAEPRLALALAVEQAAEQALDARYPQRRLRANVEFFTAVLLEALGVPRGLFTAVFASARVVGWCGHIREQADGGRLIRPKAQYVGPEVQ